VREVIERAPKPRVGSPILFRAESDGPERRVNPCSGRHRKLWLAGYVVASCPKCMCTVEMFEEAADA